MVNNFVSEENKEETTENNESLGNQMSAEAFDLNDDEEKDLVLNLSKSNSNDNEVKYIPTNLAVSENLSKALSGDITIAQNVSDDIEKLVEGPKVEKLVPGPMVQIPVEEEETKEENNNPVEEVEDLESS